MAKNIQSIISEYMADIGAKGGTAGEGDAKKRGSKAYYRELQAKAAATRRANNAARAKAEGKATTARKRKAKASA